MAKKIVYIVETPRQADAAARLLFLRINWLAEHTPFEVHLVLTKYKASVGCPLCVSPKVQVAHIRHGAVSSLFASAWGILCPAYWRELVYRKQLKRYLLKTLPDVTVVQETDHTDFLHTVMDGSCKLVELHTPKRFFGEVRGVFNTTWLTTLRRWRGVSRLKKLDAFVADTYASMREWEPTLPNIVFLPNPMEEKEGERLSACEEKQVVAIGQYHGSRGFDVVLECWQRIIFKYPDWRLKLYGEGDSSAYRAYIRDRKLSRSVSCHSLLPKMRETLSQSSVCIHVYHNDKHGACLIEALSCGLPCLSFPVYYGAGELLKENSNGFLVKPDHPLDFEVKLCLLMRNEELRKQTGEEARNSLLQYHPDHIMSQWVSLFERLNRRERKR